MFSDNGIQKFRKKYSTVYIQSLDLVQQVLNTKNPFSKFYVYEKNGWNTGEMDGKKNLFFKGNLEWILRLQKSSRIPRRTIFFKNQLWMFEKYTLYLAIWSFESSKVKLGQNVKCDFLFNLGVKTRESISEKIWRPIME